MERTPVKSNQDGAKPSSPIVDAIRHSVDSVVTSLFGVTGPQTRQATRTANQAQPAAAVTKASAATEPILDIGTNQDVVESVDPALLSKLKTLQMRKDQLRKQEETNRVEAAIKALEDELGPMKEYVDDIDDIESVLSMPDPATVRAKVLTPNPREPTNPPLSSTYSNLPRMLAKGGGAASAKNDGAPNVSQPSKLSRSLLLRPKRTRLPVSATRLVSSTIVPVPVPVVPPPSVPVPILTNMAQLLEDLAWWLQSLEQWRRDPSKGAYPIMNGKTIRDNPSLLEVVVSDMAGEDGLGEYHGTLLDTDPVYVSEQWPIGDKAIHSFEGELRALRNYLRRRLSARQYHHAQFGPAMVPASTGVERRETSSLSPSAAVSSSSLSPSLVLWCTDCESASHTINSGRCVDPQGLVVVHEIFAIAELLSITLLSLWHPRTDSAAIIADQLSHLAALLCRDSVEGRLSEVAEIRTTLTPPDGSDDRK